MVVCDIPTGRNECLAQNVQITLLDFCNTREIVSWNLIDSLTIIL